MAERRSTFPRRDADGRVAHFGDMIVATLVALVIAFVVLAAFDLVSPLAGIGGVGTSHGWLTAILALWLFVEDFRAWRGTRSRLGIMLIAVLLGLLVGGAVAYVLSQIGLPALVTGSGGAAVGTLAYASVWYFGIRLVE